MGAGDEVVIRGGNWSDTNGVDTTWMRFGAGSAARNGTAKAWIHVTAYPGPANGNAIEDVHYSTPAGASGGIAGPWSAIAGTSGEYISVSNLRMDVSGGAARDAAPVNFQYTAGPWRVVNNELGPWVAGNSAVLNAAGISGHGNGNVILGNHIHDIAGLSDLQNHGIYADTTAQNWEVAYNWIANMTGGSAIQFNDNEGGAGSYVLPHGGTWAGFTGIKIHHNWVQNAIKYGINFNDQGSTKAGTYSGTIWDNVIIGTGLPPLRISSTQPTQQLWFAYNTIYDCMTTFSGSGNGLVRNEGFGAAQSGVNNLFYDNIFAIGPDTVAGTQWFANVGGTLATATTYSFKRNLYFASTQSPDLPSTIGDLLALDRRPPLHERIDLRPHDHLRVPCPQIRHPGPADRLQGHRRLHRYDLARHRRLGPGRLLHPLMSSSTAHCNAGADHGRSTACGPVKHFIITRFNLRGSDPSSVRMIDDGYLAQRLDLFERFCLPTVRNQTVQDFRWLVLFAEDTPVRDQGAHRGLRRRLAQLRAGLPGSRPRAGRAHGGRPVPGRRAADADHDPSRQRRRTGPRLHRQGAAP